jgi:hypothetical protein
MKGVLITDIIFYLSRESPDQNKKKGSPGMKGCLNVELLSGVP